MKNPILFLLFALFGFGLYAQPTPQNFVKSDKPVQLLNHAEVMQAAGQEETVKAAKASGDVVLRVTFDEKGLYRSHELVETPDKNLTAAVEKHISKLQATPAKLDRKPISYSMNVSFRFNIFGADAIETLNFDEVRAKIGYPEKLKAKGVGGMVQVAVKADTKGNVTDFTIMGSSHKLFSEAVAKHIKELKFKPVVKNGKPALINTMISVDFNPEE